MPMDRDSIERIRRATFPLGRRGYEKREVDQFLARLADWLESGGDDQARGELVRRELERVGERTAEILAGAHDVAEQLRAEAEQEARQAREEANAYAESQRREADEYAATTRREADVHAERTRTDADTYDSETRDEADDYAERTRRAATVAAAEVREEADGYAERAQEEADSAIAEMRLKAQRDTEQKLAAAEQKAEAIVADGHRRREELDDLIADLERRRDAVIADMQRLSSELVGTATQHRPEPGEAAGPRASGEPGGEQTDLAVEEEANEQATGELDRGTGEAATESQRVGAREP